MSCARSWPPRLIGRTDRKLALAADRSGVAKDRALPFEMKLPNAETRAAIEEARAMGRACFATAQELFDDLEKTGQR
jgi:antitoxin component of RelBE/YafQ-DinJ toxin-antitoxin module